MKDKLDLAEPDTPTEKTQKERTLSLKNHKQNELNLSSLRARDDTSPLKFMQNQAVTARASVEQRRFSSLVKNQEEKEIGEFKIQPMKTDNFLQTGTLVDSVQRESSLEEQIRENELKIQALDKKLGREKRQ